MTLNINFIWVNRAGKPMPDNCAGFVAGWAKLNPEFSVKIWGAEDIAGFGDAKLSELWANKSADEAMVTNRMRLLVVNKVGGLYADVDTRPIKPIGPLLATCKDFMVGSTIFVDQATKKPKLDLNLFYSVAGSEVLGYGLTLADGTRRAGVIAGLMRDKYEDSMTICPPTFFQSHTLVSDVYTLHWPNRLASWVNRRGK